MCFTLHFWTKCINICKRNRAIKTHMRVTPPLLVRSIQVFQTVRITQRVGTQYANHHLYCTQSSNFALKAAIVIKNTRNVTFKVKRNLNFSQLASLTQILGIPSLRRLNMDCFDRNIEKYQANTIKLMFARNDFVCTCHWPYFYILYVNGNAKKRLLLLLNGMQCARPK